MTLDSLPRQEMIRVIDELSYYLGVESAAKRKISEVEYVINQGSESIKKNKKYRYMALAALCILAQGPVGVCFILIVSCLMGFAQGESDPVFTILGVLGLGFIIVAITVLRIVYKKIKKKNLEDRTKVERDISGIYAYIPYYQKVSEEYRNKALQLQATYNIHNNICAVGTLQYIKNILVSNSRVSLKEATDDYFDYIYKEQMLSEAQRQTSQIEQMRKENQQYYDSVLEKMDDIIDIENRTLDSVNYIRYY